MVSSLLTAASLASTAMAAQFVMYTPGGDDAAVERIDPIVNWGNISAHVHQLFGASGLKPDMTHDSLLTSDCTNVGSADGRQNTDDLSVYWHPSLYMEAKDGSGYIRVPSQSHKLYYRDIGNAADKLNEPFEFPAGYRALAGFPTRRAPVADGVLDWMCFASSGTLTGENGQFPKGFTECDTIPGFQARINFPHCWSGKDFDAADPDAHYAYPDGDVQTGPCPSTHPIRIPHIFSENIFDLDKVKDKVVPGSFTLSNGDTTGCGFHADFFNGWKSGAIPTLFKTCPQGEWGNHDIGTCPSFAAGPSTSTCKQSISFKEEVSNPGQYLPGCNPIVTTDPAPKMEVAPLGVCTGECRKAGSGSSSPSVPDHSHDAPAYVAPVASSAAAAIPVPSAPAVAQPPAYVAPAANPAAGNNNGNVVWVTEIVTVTAAPAGYSAATPEAAPAAPAYKRHDHMEVHRRGGRKL